MITKEAKNFELFSMNGSPLLSSGRKGASLAEVSDLTIESRIYAEGGETTLHRHPQEDHAFYVLQGEATFFDSDGNENQVSANDGVLIPRGVEYGFKRSSDGNLVMLRVGTGRNRGSEGKISDGEPLRGAGKPSGELFGNK